MKPSEVTPEIARCMRPADRARYGGMRAKPSQMAQGASALATAILAGPDAANAPVPGKVCQFEAKTERMTKTEAEYKRMYLPDSAIFEPLTIRLRNGHRYTPDFGTITPCGTVQLHEVKGAYRLGSYQRARMAFDQALVEWPCFEWVWAERRKDGGWTVKRYGVKP